MTSLIELTEKVSYDEADDEVEDIDDDDSESMNDEEVDDIDYELENSEDYTSEYVIPKISKFEKARIIGFRARQIAEGAPIYVDCNFDDVVNIAEDEFNNDKIVYDIIREYSGAGLNNKKYSKVNTDGLLRF